MDEINPELKAKLDHAASLKWDLERAVIFKYPHERMSLAELDENDVRTQRGVSVLSLHWIAMIKLASAHGWDSEHIENYYWPPKGQILTESDGRTLSESLKEVLRKISDQPTTVFGTNKQIAANDIECLRGILSGDGKWVIEQYCKKLKEGPFRICSATDFQS